MIKIIIQFVDYKVKLIKNNTNLNISILIKN